MNRRIFLDTAFLLAVINRSDEYHASATKYYRSLIEQKWLLVTTEAVLIETGNSLAKQRARTAA
jgi:predicted nucleic acid-binding protein